MRISLDRWAMGPYQIDGIKHRGFYERGAVLREEKGEFLSWRSKSVTIVQDSHGY
jgi:hypothetical protein